MGPRQGHTFLPPRLPILRMRESIIRDALGFNAMSTNCSNRIQVDKK